tara:strand:+ start:7539 stop:8402 length:864 start_codon:yes stop_codon:yes gene_type:complete
MLIAFTKANLPLFKEAITITTLIEQTTLFFLSCFLILTFNFITNKNSLTKNNHYQILLFGLFFLMLPQTTIGKDFLFANFFVFLGLRKILSLKTELQTKKKLFDAAFWFGIAALFYIWALLFVILIFGTLILYTDKRLKNWLVPFVGLATVFVISSSVSIIFFDDFLEIFTTSLGVSYTYNIYNTPQFLIAITMLLSFGVWASIFYVKILNKKKKALRPSFKIIFMMVVIAFVIIVLAPQKNGSEFLFLFAPLSVIIANYIESIKDKWFKESFFAILIVVPFILLVL